MERDSKRDYSEIFQKATYVEPRDGFEQSMLDGIHKLEKRRFFVKQSLYALISCASFAGVIGSVIFALKALSSSGIYDYVSLLFSDIETLSYLKEFTLSIAESLPFLELAFVFAIVAVFIWSLLKTIKAHGYKEIYTTQIA
jgi:hypothetical protein